ncbi:hypothetical protein [Psychrobacter sp. DAB_AL32B]|uniref:hypothetical protein n=1 Tax=Psychrobacter sp. DAB_AL32B TaxID=1028414 RepID=UPI000B7D9226|nr:hypothetical protein [Psychrobacter sp. DAB_AL32B]OXL22843.1 hypothetical protein CAN34_08605 [Psychrobacter sp. DAB_AL32B]
MIIIWLPLLLGISLYLIAHFYNKRQGRQIFWKGNVKKNILALFFITFAFGGGVYYILDPNEMGRSVTTTSYSYLYTGGRIIGFGLITIAYTLFHFLFLNSANLRTIKVQKKVKLESDLLWIGYKTIFVLASITAIASGTYGFLTHNCLGLFENRYISDTFMWWAELGWCIFGVIGLFCYFRYIRYWDGEEGNSDH